MVSLTKTVLLRHRPELEVGICMKEAGVVPVNSASQSSSVSSLVFFSLEEELYLCAGKCKWTPAERMEVGRMGYLAFHMKEKSFEQRETLDAFTTIISVERKVGCWLFVITSAASVMPSDGTSQTRQCIQKEKLGVMSAW